MGKGRLIRLPIIDPLPRQCSGDRILLPLRKAYLVAAKQEGLYRTLTCSEVVQVYTPEYIEQLLETASRLTWQEMVRRRTHDELA